MVCMLLVNPCFFFFTFEHTSIEFICDLPHTHVHSQPSQCYRHPACVISFGGYWKGALKCLVSRCKICSSVSCGAPSYVHYLEWKVVQDAKWANVLGGRLLLSLLLLLNEPFPTSLLSCLAACLSCFLDSVRHSPRFMCIVWFSMVWTFRGN